MWLLKINLFTKNKIYVLMVWFVMIHKIVTKIREYREIIDLYFCSTIRSMIKNVTTREGTKIFIWM